nr:uncharacterized protein LOC115497339 [Taeniopygia guttata]
MDRELSQWEDVQETCQREVPGVQEMSQRGARSSQELYQGQSPTEAEPAAAAWAGAAEEEEKPPEPLVPEAEKAVEPPALREGLPSAGTQSPVPAPRSPPGCSQALLDLAWSISCDILSQALLHIQECREQLAEQRRLGGTEDPAVAARGTAEREESPVPDPRSPPGCSQALLDLAWSISCEVLSQALLHIQERREQQEEQRHLGETEDPAVAAKGTAEREESPVPAPRRPPGCSQALLDLAWSISCDILSQALLHIQGCRQQLEEQRRLGETEDPAVAARCTAEREESTVRDPRSPPGCSQALLELAWSISCEVLSHALLHIQECREQQEEQRCLGETEDPAVAAKGTAEREESLVPDPRRPPGCSQALLNLAWSISCDVLSQALLHIQECREQQEEQRCLGETEDPAVAARGTAEREESPVPAPYSPPGPSSALLGVPVPREEPGWAVAALTGSVLAQDSLETLAWDSDWSSDSEDEEEEVEPELSQGTDSLVQELSQEDDVNPSSGEKPVDPVKEGDTQPSPPEGPSSSSPVGTEVAAEAAPALPGTSPAPGSPMEAKLAAAAPAGAAEEAAAGSVPAVRERMDDSDEENKFWTFLDDLEPFLVGDPELFQEASYCEECAEEDLPHGECEKVMSSHQLSDREEYLEQDLSQGEVSSLQDPSDWDEHTEQILSREDVISCVELSDWEEYVGQNVSRGNGSRPSGHSSWENDSDTGLMQENWPEHVILAKPLCPEDDEWDDGVSLLELPPEDNNDQKLKVFGADWLPVPFPREVWVECPAQEPCSQGPAPAPHSSPSPWPARLGAQALRGQPAAPRKRPSRFRRVLQALRGLFRWPRLRPRPEE